MKTKNLLFFLAALCLIVISPGCQKQANQVAPLTNTSTDQPKQTTVTKGVYDYSKDTTTKRAATSSAGKLKVFYNSGAVSLEVDYKGNNIYEFNASIDLLNQSYFTFGIEKNHTPYELLTDQDYHISIDRILGVGTYRVDGTSGDADPFMVGQQSSYFVVVNGPVVPTGYVPFLEYYNYGIGKHYYDNDWEKFASGSQNWIFEKNQGFMYASATAGATPLYGYYCAGNSDHYYTTTYSNYQGYVYEGIVGFIPTGYSSIFPNALAEYYNYNTGEHFYSTVPPVAGNPDMLFSKTVGYIQ